jgi:S-adenosylmethionine synthetase
MNIASAYPKQSGIQSWIRTVQLNKKEGIATIADKFSITNVADTITQSFMTTCAADLSKEGKIFFSLPDGNSNVILEYDATEWKAMKEKIVLSTPEDERFKQSWGGKEIWRILLVNRIHQALAQTVYRIHK